MKNKTKKLLVVKVYSGGLYKQKVPKTTWTTFQHVSENAS